jgi:hypothetical protein
MRALKVAAGRSVEARISVIARDGDKGAGGGGGPAWVMEQSASEKKSVMATLSKNLSLYIGILLLL